MRKNNLGFVEEDRNRVRIIFLVLLVEGYYYRFFSEEELVIDIRSYRMFFGVFCV